MSLGYDCGTHTVCGISTDCGSCVDPERCSVTGKCAVVSPVSVTIDEPRDGLEYTQGSFIQFHGFVLGGQPDYTYSWSSDKDGVFSVNLWANTNALSVNTHIITLTVTDNKGVSSSDSITLTVRPLGTLTAQIGMWQTEFVHGDMIFFGVDVTSGILPYTFVWNSNHEGDFSIEQGPTVNTGIPPWTPGTHTITFTVTDFPENTATDTIDITITEMTVRIMPQDGRHFVYSESVGFVAMVVGGVAPYAYSWISDLDGMIGAVDNFQRDDLQEGVHTITVTIADSSSPPRTITKTIHIQIDSPPVLTVAIDNPLDSLTFKQGEDVSFEGSSAGGVGPYEFIWRSNVDGDFFTDINNPNFIKNDLSVDTHIITLTAKDYSNQVATNNIDIVINPPVPLVATITSPNNGDAFLITDDIITFDSSVSGGVSHYTYKWMSDKDGDITPADSQANKVLRNDLSVNDHLITLEITDSVGAIAMDTVSIQVHAGCASNNVKDPIKYGIKETFLISDIDWRNVLSLVPLSIWNDGTTIKKHPALIYHHEAAAVFDADSTIHFMQLYEPNHLTTIGSIPADLNNLLVAAEPTGAGLNADDISNINPHDYFSYWSSFNSIVVVDYDDYKAGLMASVFASHKNSPIIFVNSANLDTYKIMINGKTIYTVSTLDAATQSYVDSNAGCQISYTLEELQIWYATETNTDKLIFVNPGDLNINLDESYVTEKGRTVRSVFGNMSLTSPFLAAAKQEVIAFTELPDSGTNSECNDNAVLSANIVQADADAAYAIQNLFLNKPDILTIIAWPQAIPDSEYDYNVGTFQIRKSKDWRYGSLDNINFDLNVGRIYGVTVADASANVARSIFYDTLIDIVYGSSYTGTTIALAGWNAENKAEIVKQKTTTSGYTSLCYVSDDSDNPDCGTLPAGEGMQDSDFQNKRFILFEGHGNSSNWCGATHTVATPWMSLPYVMADACLTNNYWQGQGTTISIGMLRKGAIVYYGAASVTYGPHSGLTHFYDIIEELTGSDANTITLGEVHSSDSDKSKKDYIFLGDPTLQLKLKEVTW